MSRNPNPLPQPDAYRAHRTAPVDASARVHAMDELYTERRIYQGAVQADLLTAPAGARYTSFLTAHAPQAATTTARTLAARDLIERAIMMVSQREGRPLWRVASAGAQIIVVERC